MSFLFDVSRSTDSRQSMRSFVTFWGLVVRDLLQFRNKGGKKKDILFRRVCFMYLSLWWLGKKFIDGLIKINRIERRGKNNVENSRADGNKSN